MESCKDFIQWLGNDLSMRILTSLDDPSDIIRFSAVSTYWRDFAIDNGLSKQLCLRKFPEFLKITNITEEKNRKQVSSYKTREQEILERDHKLYAYLAEGLANSNTHSCISNAVTASSTNDYPKESVQNTLEPRVRVGDRDSYWSSTGQTNPTVSEKLVYVLVSNICVVTEIRVQPFQGQWLSIYSPRNVRFRMGYPKSPLKVDNYGRFKYKSSHKYDDNAFTWTYISLEFPVAQSNSLQTFKLPEPVLCIGGIIQIELSGRVQSKETDNLYYICISHIQVVGRPLSPGCDGERIERICKLRNYRPGAKFRVQPRAVFFGVLSLFGRASSILFLALTFIFFLFLIKLFQNFNSLRYTCRETDDLNAI